MAHIPGVVHLLVTYGVMKLDFLEKYNLDNIPFEVFLALNLDAFLNRTYHEGERLLQVIKSRLRQPIIPADEFIKITKPDIEEDIVRVVLMFAIFYTPDMDKLCETLSTYRVPILM